MKIRLPHLAGILVLTSMATVVRAEEKKYTLQDLQALDQRQAWEEMRIHLLDVPPADRNGSWNRVVEHACLQPGQLEAVVAMSCGEPLMSILRNEPTNQDFAWRAGKWARINLASHSAVPFFAAAGLKAEDPRCKDDDVAIAAVAGLGLAMSGNEKIVSQSRDLAFEKCWPATQQRLLKELQDGGYFATNACPDLKKKKALSAADAKKCAAAK